MNTIKSLFVAFAAIAATSAFAQEATPESHAPQATSTVSRQAVHQEAVAAVAAGKIVFGEADRGAFESAAGMSQPRAKVHAEAVEAQRLGLTQGGEFQRSATAAEAELIRLAGERAVTKTLAAR